METKRLTGLDEKAESVPALKRVSEFEALSKERQVDRGRQRSVDLDPG